MGVTWLSHGCHMIITWVSHDCHVPSVYCHLLCFLYQGLTAKEVCDFFFKEDTRLEWEGESAAPFSSDVAPTLQSMTQLCVVGAMV